MPHHVVTVLAPGANPFEFAVTSEVFGLARPAPGDGWYEHRLAATQRPLVVDGGWTLDTPHGLEALDDADTVIVPACPEEPPRTLVTALRAAHERGARMVSLRAGARALAAAGILDGRRVTTHWVHAEELARRYPSVRVVPDVLYIDEGQVLTGAGTAGGIDLALHIVRRDFGAEIANEVARRVLAGPHRDGSQSQRVHEPAPAVASEVALAPVIDWVLDHLDEPLTVTCLARRAGMSTRTFTRRFREVVGTSPLRWVRHQRVLRAQDLLEASDLTIDAIARRVGFGSAVSLRRHFLRVTSMTPLAYRHRYRRSGSRARPRRGPRQQNPRVSGAVSG
jgi:AraC family transcriptional regulator, transcriptional activator FtrA